MDIPCRLDICGFMTGKYEDWVFGRRTIGLATEEPTHNVAGCKLSIHH
jgi:hypothetical protein